MSTISPGSWSGQPWGSPPAQSYEPETVEAVPVEETMYVRDAHTGDIYHGVVHKTLQDAYNRTGKRVTPSHSSTWVGDKQPILARNVVTHDDVTNEDITTWYCVNLDNVMPGPLPGEWKLIHLTNEP